MLRRAIGGERLPDRCSAIVALLKEVSFRRVAGEVKLMLSGVVSGVVKAQSAPGDDRMSAEHRVGLHIASMYP
jgi:hypothetical protein